MPTTESKIEEFTDWVKKEAGLVEHLAEYTVAEIKQAFASGLVNLKGLKMNQEMQKIGIALDKLSNPPTPPETDSQGPQTTNTGATLA